MAKESLALNEDQEVDYGWLEFRKLPKQVDNPFDDISYKKFLDDPGQEIMHIASNPDYFYFITKYLLNLELFPYQLVVLEAFWNHRLPIFIATRGAAKSMMLGVYCLMKMILEPGTKIAIVGAGLRQARNVHDYMVEVWKTSPVLRSLYGRGSKAHPNGPKRETDRFTFRMNDSVSSALPLGTGQTIRGIRANILVSDESSCLRGGTLIETNRGLERIKDTFRQGVKIKTGDDKCPMESPDKLIKTKKQNYYTVKTKYGLEFGCSDIHKVLTTDGWKLGKDLKKGDYLIHKNTYEFPTKKIKRNGYELDEKMAWLLGILVAKGSVQTNHTVSVHMTDKDAIDKIYNLLVNEYSISPSIDRREAYIDDRGRDCKEAWVVRFCNAKFRKVLRRFGLTHANFYKKETPKYILQSPRSVVVAYLSGLFEGDGTGFKTKYCSKDEYLYRTAYYSSSKQLCQETQMLMSKLGWLGGLSKRKSEISDRDQWMLSLNAQVAYEVITELDVDKWKDLKKEVYYNNTRPGYFLWESGYKTSVQWAGKNKCIGSKETKEEAKELRDNWIKENGIALPVLYVDKSEEKEHLYDYHLPVTHQFYGNGFIQHNSISPEIFNQVVIPFAAVSKNPVEKVKAYYRKEVLKQKGIWDESLQEAFEVGQDKNQIIRAGTPTTSFNHFYHTFHQFREIIRSKGDEGYLKEKFGNEFKIQEGFDWRDHCIIRVPYQYLPKGLQDQGIVEQARQTLTKGQFLQEFCSVFLRDTDGFYKRSTIENATTTKPVALPSGEKIQFSPMKTGNPECKYVIGIDPAADRDNAALTIFEVYPDHRRVVYTWSVNQKKFQSLQKYKNKTTSEYASTLYYEFIAKKIRSLMSVFNTVRITMDRNGGGIAIGEELRKKSNLEKGEFPVYEIVSENIDNPGPYDQEEGLHILEFIKPNSERNRDMNHLMLKDLESRTLLFPMIDHLELARSSQIEISEGLDMEEYASLEQQASFIFDTYENIVNEIEDQKKELESIVVTYTATGLENFDTPKLKREGDEKGAYKKDRYSALLYANYAARSIFEGNQGNNMIQYKPMGRVAGSGGIIQHKKTDKLYSGAGAMNNQNSNGLHRVR